MAISGRQLQFVQGVDKMHGPIASVAALTAQPLAALPPYGCGVPLAGSERHAGCQYLRHGFNGMRLPGLSLRGPNGAVAISGRQLRFRRGFPVIHSGTARLPRRFAPRNDTSGECGGAPAPSSGLMTPYKALTDCRYTPYFGAYRLTTADTSRRCFPEIAPQGHFLALRAQGATAPLGPRNDKLEGLAPQNACRKDCQPARRSLSAATVKPGGVYGRRCLSHSGSAFPRLPRRPTASSQ